MKANAAAAMAGLVPPGTTVKPDASTAKPKEEEKVDYMNLPCPIPYEEIHREALSLYLYHLYSYFTRHYNNSTELYVNFFFLFCLSLVFDFVSEGFTCFCGFN